MNDTAKKIINVIIFVFIFVIVGMLVKLGSTLLLFLALDVLTDVLTIESVLSGATEMPLLLLNILSGSISFLLVLLTIAITLGIFRFAHFKTSRHLSDNERLLRRRKTERTIGIVLVAICGVIFSFFFLSSVLYEISGCSGGVGSGISCTGQMETLVAATQMLVFMFSILLGPFLLPIFFLGLYFLARYSWKQAVAVFLIFAVPTVVMLSVFASRQKHEYNQELVRRTTPTETVFVCDEYSSLELYNNGVLGKFRQTDFSRSDSYMGDVDFNSNTFSFGTYASATSEKVERHMKNLHSCRNINGDSISDLYTINPPQDVFQEN